MGGGKDDTIPLYYALLRSLTDTILTLWDTLNVGGNLQLPQLYENIGVTRVGA